MYSLVATADRRDSLIFKAGMVLLGTGVITASSYVSVPMYPVPMTMQTLAIMLIGASCGPKAGFATVMAWLMEAAIGLPVLAGGMGGLAAFAGPTAGFLFVFPFAAALSGLIAGESRNVLRLSFAVAAGCALSLTGGWAWLATVYGMGATAAFMAGVAPFMLGEAVKAGIGGTALRLARK